MSAATPFHLRQLERTLPHWSRLTPSPHISAMLNTQRKDYLQADGQPFAWYAHASQAQRQALHQAIEQRNTSRNALHTSLKQLKGVSEFCKPLLEQRLDIAVPVDEAIYFFQPFKRRPSVLVEPEAGLGTANEPERFEYDPDGTPRKITLLEAALHNFTDTAEAGPYSQLHNSKANATLLVGHTPLSFIEACRDLDLGKQYQDHLASIYDGAERAILERQSIQANRDELLVQARIAALRGNLGSHGLDALERLCSGNTAQPLACWRLSLHHTPLHEVMVIGSNATDRATPRIIYIPGAHDAPLVEYPSASAAAGALTVRLQDERLLQQVIRFAPQAQQPQLTRTLREQLFDTLVAPNTPGIMPKLSARLLYQATELPAEPWAFLYQAHVRRLKADAASLAVPTAQVDASARLALLEHLVSVGLDLANVAALFIPGLNTVMLAVGAAQLMTSVFHGIEAWEDDDKAQAAAQLESVLLNLAFIGVVGGGVALLKQSRFVDSLLRIEHEGGERLWQPELGHYASAEVLPDALESNEQGQYSQQQRHFIRLDGTLFEQSRDPAGAWRINHPEDHLAYRPGARHVGQGAWRVAGEQPLDWPQARLLRRIGPITDNLSNTDLGTALRCTGSDEQVLRHTHVSESPAPALLADAIERLAIDQEAAELITRVRHGLSVAPYKQYALNSLVELPGWPSDHVLKVFEGPERWGTATFHGDTTQAMPVEIEVTRSDLELGTLSQTVLEQLDEQAANALVPGNGMPSSRASALDEQLANHLTERRNALFDALYQSRQQPLDSAGDALKRQFASLPARVINEITRNASVVERTHMLSGRIPLRIAEEARVHLTHVRLDRALLGLHRPCLANTDSQRLAAALLAEQPGASAGELVETALADRQKAARLIGQQPIRPGYRSPLRLADGRLGYPLSGRGSWRDWIRLGGQSIEERRLQELYPALTAQQRRNLLNQLRQRGNAGEQLVHLQRERAALEQSLSAWNDAAEGEAHQNRRAFSDALRRAARQDDGNVLNLQHMRLDTLPELTARFDHIQTLHMHELGLRSLPTSFLEAFPRLERLRLTANPQLQGESLFGALRHAPQLRILEVINSPLGNLDATAREVLARLPRLRALRLREAGLSLTDADLQVLTRLPLEELDLSRNRISLDAGLAQRFGEMQQLQVLDLSHNLLQTPPSVASLHLLRNLTLNDCHLGAWPEQLTSLMNRHNYALRNLELSANDIHQLPAVDQILETRYARNLLVRNNQRWEFHFNNLAPETAQALRATGVAIVEQHDFLSPAEAVDWRTTGTATQQHLWDQVFEDGANHDLREVIERVGRSAQAQHNQASLAQEVWQLLDAASQDQALREHLNEVAGDFPATCGDAGADGFSTLQVEQLAYRESSQADIRGPYLFQFYRRLFRREQVNRLAARIHVARLDRQAALLDWERTPAEQRAALRPLPNADSLDDITNDELLEGGLDDIEIRLALRQSLAQPLEFPEPSRDMLYRDTARVSDIVVDNVADAVEALDEQPATRRAWIGAQPGWQRFLRRHFSQRFATLDARWYRGIEYLEYCVDPANEAVTDLDTSVREVLNEVLPEAVPDATGVLPRLKLDSQQYTQALERLGASRQTEEERLYKRLTAQQDPNDQN